MIKYAYCLVFMPHANGDKIIKSINFQQFTLDKMKIKIECATS